MSVLTAKTPWLVDGAGNVPVPPTVLADLESINPRLGLKFHPGLRAFCVTLRWPEDDPRREAIKRGEIDASSDAELLCPVPADLSLDDLRGWLQRQLVRVGESREDVRRMIAKQEEATAKHNATVAEAVAAEAREELLTNVTAPATIAGKRRNKIVLEK